MTAEWTRFVLPASATLTREATVLVHEAIVLLGNGVKERFSAAPRHDDESLHQIHDGVRGGTA